MSSARLMRLDNSFVVGDWVRINDKEGRVVEVRWRYTAIETRNGDTIYIPNNVLAKSEILFLGRRIGRPLQHRMWIYFHVDYRYTPNEVIDAVQKALRLEPIANVASEPPPNCILFDFKDSYSVYAVRYWLTDLAHDDPTNSVIRTRIYAALRRASIPLSIPAQAVFLTKETESRELHKNEETLAYRTVALKRLAIFKTLTEPELQTLAARLKEAPYTRGEAITKQGAVAHWLYIILSGDVEVWFEQNRERKKVAALRDGDFFGEFGMMTGKPRTSTVLAITDVVCFRLDNLAFQDVITARPKLAEEISHIMVARKRAL
jgi:hypothetical protein